MKINQADRERIVSELRQVSQELTAARESTSDASAALNLPQIPQPYPREIQRAAAWVYNARNVVEIILRRIEEMEALDGKRI